MIAELDVIELRVPVGRWALGTTGTVHAVRDDHLLVEISDDNGVMLDLLTVPVRAATVIWSAAEHGRPSASQPSRRVA